MKPGGRSPKTHNGVQAQFARLVKDKPAITVEMRAFLGRTYNLKAIADYETAPDFKVTTAQATEAIVDASQFVAAVAALLPEGTARDR